jgi:hypothetical protein
MGHVKPWAVVYRPPGTSVNTFRETLDLVDHALHVNESWGGAKILMGDLNFPGIKWPHGLTGKGESSDMVQARDLLKLGQDHFLTQVVQDPTQGDNILDLVFTRDRSLLKSSNIIDNKLLSDHNTIVFDLNWSLGMSKDTKHSNPYITRIVEHMVYKADEEDWIRYQEEMAAINWEVETAGMDTTEKLNYLTLKIKKSVVLLINQHTSSTLPALPVSCGQVYGQER